VWQTRRMHTPACANRYKQHCFPAEIISHGIWLYCRFYLSYRNVEKRPCQVTWDAQKVFTG